MARTSAAWSFNTPIIDALRRGEKISAGLEVDFLDDARRSADEGLPVFHIDGSVGFIWAIQYSDDGKGRLKIAAVDASLLPKPADGQLPVPSPQPPPSTASPPPSTPSPWTTSGDDDARREKARAERLDKVVQAATKQLNYAAQFITEHPRNPKLLDYLDETAALKAAVEKGDPDDIERMSGAILG